MIKCYYCDETVEEEQANNEGWLWGRIRGKEATETELATLMPVPPACPRHVASLRLMLTAGAWDEFGLPYAIRLG